MSAFPKESNGKPSLTLDLLQAVLPTDLGYGYCVIDNEGKVLFHSDASRNLLENFFAESDQDGYLRSVVLGNETKGLNLRYQGVDHRLFVRPIPNTLWSLVTFRDKQVLRTATLEIIAYSIFLFILYALLLLVLFTLYYLGNTQDTAGIVWPYLRRAPNYYLSIIVNLALAMVFAVAIFVCNTETILFLTFLLPTLGFLFHHYNLKKGAKLGPHAEAVTNFVEHHTPLNYRSGYVLTLVTLLLLVSVLPMLAFFKFAYDREMSLFVGMGQINFARALEERRERIEAQYSPDDKNPDTAKQVRNLLQKRLNLNCDSESKSSFCDLYNEFFFGTQFGFIDKGLTNHSQAEDRIERFLTALVPFNNSISLKVHGLKSGSLQREDSQENLVLHTNEKVDESAANNTLEVKSVPTVLGGKGQHPMWWFGLAVVLMFLLPTGLFILINFIGKRIFLLNTDEPRILYGEEFCHGCVSQNLLVLGSSFTRKDELLKRDDLEVIDLRKATKKGWTKLYNERPAEDKHRAIALDYFEYDWEDPATNQNKLRLLESYLLENKKIVVLSAVNLLDYRFDASANGQVEQNGNHERSVRLFGSFLNVYLEDIGDVKSFSKQILEFETEWRKSKRTRKEQRHMTRLLRTLKRECQARAYLQKLGKDLLTQAGFEGFTPESIVSHVKDEANAYYHAIWDTCSKDERVTLYTLAKYHVVSSMNCDLPRLLRRGLISREPYLRPMNESFTRFIVAETSPEKLVAWRRVEERNSWEMLRIPLIVILISVAAFLFFSQRELYNSTLAFVSAFAAAMPSIFKFLGLVSSAKTVS